jgi:uncharacterized protein DUF397
VTPPSVHRPRGDSDPVTQWRKSSFSLANGNCVEVASGLHAGIGVRDSTDPGGPVLRFTPDEWHAFLGPMRKR